MYYRIHQAPAPIYYKVGVEWIRDTMNMKAFALFASNSKQQKNIQEDHWNGPEALTWY